MNLFKRVLIPNYYRNRFILASQIHSHNTRNFKLFSLFSFFSLILDSLSNQYSKILNLVSMP